MIQLWHDFYNNLHIYKKINIFKSMRNETSIFLFKTTILYLIIITKDFCHLSKYVENSSHKRERYHAK